MAMPSGARCHLKDARAYQHVVNSSLSNQMLCILMVLAPRRATRKSYLSGAFVFPDHSDPQFQKFRTKHTPAPHEKKVKLSPPPLAH